LKAAKTVDGGQMKSMRPAEKSAEAEARTATFTPST
jgi:hypothetical protein